MTISSEVEAKQVRIVKGTGSQIASARQAGEILDTDLVVQTDAPEPATAEQGALADTALQPGDNITELVNNAGYQTSSQVNTAISSHNTDQSAHSYIQGLISSEESRAEGVEGTLSNLTTDVKNNLVSAINEVDSHADTNTSDISGIKALIPNDATAQNQLADKQFVNSSIATNTANFIGTFNSVADLEAYSGTLTNNDYAFVVGTDTAGNTVYDRYKYTDATTPASWVFEYELNNSSFTADQWAAINSLATAGKITQITTNQNAIGTLSSLTTTTKTNLVGAINELNSNKVNSNTAITGATKCKITYDGKGLVTGGADLSASDIPSLTLSKISDITATASELNVLDGITASTTELNYTDGVTSNIQTQLNGKQPTGNYMTTDTEQSVNAGAIKTFNGRVNFYGTGDSNAIYLSTNTRINVQNTTNTVLGFANGTFLINNSAYPLNLRGSGARPAWNGTSYLALTSDIGNATLTIQKNGTAVDTFSANATSDKTINITVPTKTSDLTNDDGFITGITSSDVTTALGYTPYNSSNPSGYQANVIETVKVNGTALTPSSKAVDITVPTNNNQLTNGAGYITSSALTGYATETWVGQQGFLTSTALNGYATQQWVGQQGFITGITSSDVTTALGYTPVNPTALATVATSGSYNDLSNKPTIPAAQVNSDWNANSGVAQILNKPTLATVATSGAYSDLIGKPTIPTVNNPTITITQGGVTKGSFTLNQSSGDTIALDAGGSSIDIDNVSITKNGDDELQTIGVINQNNATTALKQWSGTKAQYDAIVTKDANTVYNITDDVPSTLNFYTKTETDSLLSNYATTTALSEKIQLVSTLPATPINGVLYVIPE